VALHALHAPLEGGDRTLPLVLIGRYGGDGEATTRLFHARLRLFSTTGRRKLHIGLAGCFILIEIGRLAWGSRTGRPLRTDIAEFRAGCRRHAATEARTTRTTCGQATAGRRLAGPGREAEAHRALRTIAIAAGRTLTTRTIEATRSATLAVETATFARGAITPGTEATAFTRGSTFGTRTETTLAVETATFTRGSAFTRAETTLTRGTPIAAIATRAIATRRTTISGTAEIVAIETRRALPEITLGRFVARAIRL
jgi:hypothetical protein